MNPITCDNLCRGFQTARRGRSVALDGVSFRLASGGITGVLGPDGAGKTTLLRVLAGLLRPDSGRATVAGLDTVADGGKIQRMIGYMPQKFGLYASLTVLENLTLYADLHDVPEHIRRERFAQLLKMTGLERFPDRLSGDLSGGMKSKLALACSLVSLPSILLLDEPTVGVDVVARRELWGLLKKIAAENGTTVLVSTSYMDEADFCDRVIVLFKGKIIADGVPEAVRRVAASDVPNPTFEQGFYKLVTGLVPPPLKRLSPPAPDAPVMVRASGLVKKFGKFVAVDHISFEVRKGEIFGLLGANGAGKTTTFRMLCGLDPATAGEIAISGVNLRTAGGAARAKLGFVAQKFSLYTDLTPRENLEFFGGAYGLFGDRLKQRVAAVVAEFRLEEHLDVSASDLPLGVKQRLSVACALLHEPEILFLDEATSGADPVTRRDFWKRAMALADRGVAVVVTTHFLDEADYCDRIMIMRDGKCAAAGTVEEIRRTGTPEGAELVSVEEAFVNIVKREVRDER